MYFSEPEVEHPEEDKAVRGPDSQGEGERVAYAQVSV